ncbi:CoA-binding protein [Chloroflexota bacterium]
MENQKPSLEEVFSPRGVAVVGASPIGRNSEFVQSLQESGFPVIYPVNPKYTDIAGLPCYPSLKDIPGVVDYVIVSIPAESTLALLDDCAAKGIKAVHFFTAGFSESGHTERAELESAMLEKARAGGFRIIGPNCDGISVPKSRLLSWIKMPLEAGPIAFISQSGGNAASLPFFNSPRGLRFSKVVSYGNALDVNESELLHYLSQDPETEIIAAYIEGVKDGRQFLNVLKEAATRKPVVIYQGGTTEAGRRATHGHTASLTSSAVVFDVLCRQMNTIQVDDLDELADVLVALRFVTPLPRGTGVAVVGVGGGPAVLASDEMERVGLHLPNLSPEVEVELRQLLPIAGTIFSNPLDSLFLMSPEGLLASLRVLGKLPYIHMFVYHMGFHPATRWDDGRFSSADFLQPTIDSLTTAMKVTSRPIVIVLRPPPGLSGMKDFLTVQEAFVDARFPVFHSLRQVAKAMARVVAWNQAQ